MKSEDGEPSKKGQIQAIKFEYPYSNSGMPASLETVENSNMQEVIEMQLRQL
jgi:hypothetical protein